jgi:hypothetical protein
MALDIENFLDHKPVIASADIRRIQLPGQLKLSILRNHKLAFECTVTESVYLGRQRANEEGPYSKKVVEGRLRLIIAAQGEDSVSETHAALEPLQCGRVRIVNLSLRLPIKLVDGHELLAEGAVNLALPVKFALGSNLIELNWIEKRPEQTTTAAHIQARQAHAAPAAMAVFPEPKSIQGHRALKAGIAAGVLVAIVGLALPFVVSDNPRLRAMLGGLFWLGILLSVLCYFPTARRRNLAKQKEKDRRVLAKFGLGERPNFLQEWLVLNTGVWAGLALLLVGLVWFFLLPLTVIVPFVQLLRWRRLARLKATLPNSPSPKGGQPAASPASAGALSSEIQAQASVGAAPSAETVRGC